MSRERVTITINKDVLSKIDKQIDRVKNRNRSHIIENIISEYLNLQKIKDVIIMAGGEEANKSIDAIKDAIIRLKAFGIDEIIIALGYLGENIKKALGDGKELNIKIDYLDKGEGSGGSILKLKNALKNTFIVVNLDKKIEIDYKMAIDFHKKTGKSATVATNDIKTLRGIYILEPEIISLLPKGFSMLEEDIFPRLIKENKLNIYPII